MARSMHAAACSGVLERQALCLRRNAHSLYMWHASLYIVMYVRTCGKRMRAFTLQRSPFLIWVSAPLHKSGRLFALCCRAFAVALGFHAGIFAFCAVPSRLPDAPPCKITPTGCNAQPSSRLLPYPLPFDEHNASSGEWRETIDGRKKDLPEARKMRHPRPSAL